MKKILFLSLLLITSLVSSQSQINMIAGGVPFCAEYQAVYDAYTTKPDDATATIYNTMVEKLVAAGLWSTQWDIVRGYGMTTNTAGEALINWKQPSGGASLMDAGKGTFDSGTESWIKYGNNTIASELVDGVNALKVTYVDNANGAYVFLNAAKDINTDLTVGKTYRFAVRAKVNAGSTVGLQMTGPNTILAIVTATDFTWHYGIATCTNATTNALNTPGMGAGEIIWIDEWYIQEWTGATAYNAPTFTALQGFTFNGTTQYINNNWVPSVSGVNYTQNSASQVLYIRTDVASSVAANGHGVYGSADSKDCWLNPRRDNNNSYRRNNDATNSNITNSNGSGLYVNTRTASNVKVLYRNGIALNTGTIASVGVPTHSPYTGAYNDDDDDGAVGFRADQVFFEAWGAGLSQAQVTTLNAIIEEAADALGVGVQSPTMLVFVLMLILYIGNRKKFTYEKADRYINSDLRRAA